MAEASVGQQSPQVALYRTYNLCPVKTSLQAAAVSSMGSSEHQYNLVGILTQDYHLQEEEEGGQETEQSLEVLEKTLSDSQENDMPLEELFALYGYEPSDPISEQDSEGTNLPHSLPDMTLDKEQITKDLLPGEEEEETQSSADDLTPSVTSHDASDLFPHPMGSNSLIPEEQDSSSSSNEDEDEEVSEDDSVTANGCKKEMMVGPQYQAIIPPLSGERLSDKAYDSEDQLLWDPHVMPEREVEEFLYRAAKRSWEESDNDSLPEGTEVKDSEQALYELVKCNFNPEEALRRLRFNVKVIRDELCAWSEEECRHFEHGFRVHGKNFHLIQANKVRTRSVGECVEYYYLWKKSDRYDYFTQQTRFGRKKYVLQSGSLDYVDNDLEGGEADDASRARSSPPTPSVTSCLDSHFNQDHLEIDNAESPDVGSVVCSMGSLSETDQVYKYSTSSVNTSDANCPFDSSSSCEDPADVTTQGTANNVSPTEITFYETPEEHVLTETGVPSPSCAHREVELPADLNDGLSLIPDSVELKDEPVTVTSGHVSLSVTDFGIIGIGDVNRFLGAHTTHSGHPAAMVQAESLSQ